MQRVFLNSLHVVCLVTCFVVVAFDADAAVVVGGVVVVLFVCFVVAVVV